MLNAAANAGRAADAGAADRREQQGSIDRGGTDLQRAVLRVSWPGRTGHTQAGARDHDGAAARGIAARQRSSRLHQSRSVLHGLTGPVDGKTLHGHDDPDGHARTTSGSRRSHRSSATTSATAADSSHRLMSRACARPPPAAQALWTVPELTASMPIALFTDGWKLTASHNTEAALGALSLTAWNAGAATGRHVVPGRTSEARDGHRDSVPVAAARRPRRRRKCSGCNRQRCSCRGPGRFPARLQGRGVVGRLVVVGRVRREKQRPHDD